MLQIIDGGDAHPFTRYVVVLLYSVVGDMMSCSRAVSLHTRQIRLTHHHTTEPPAYQHADMLELRGDVGWMFRFGGGRGDTSWAPTLLSSLSPLCLSAYRSTCAVVLSCGDQSSPCGVRCCAQYLSWERQAHPRNSSDHGCPGGRVLFLLDEKRDKEEKQGEEAGRPAFGGKKIEDQTKIGRYIATTSHERPPSAFPVKRAVDII